MAKLKVKKGKIGYSELQHRLKNPNEYEWYSEVHNGVVLSFKRMKELMDMLEVKYTIDYVHLVFKDIKWSK